LDLASPRAGDATAHELDPPRAPRGATHPAPPTLELIQVYRGAAATIVMLYHLTTTNHFYSPFLGNAFGWGHSGIDFFFVLSGFIMLYVHYDRAGQARET